MYNIRAMFPQQPSAHEIRKGTEYFVQTHLSHIYDRILHAALEGSNNTLYSTLNSGTLTSAVIESLTKNGYQVHQTNTGMLHIEW